MSYILWPLGASRRSLIFWRDFCCPTFLWLFPHQSAFSQELCHSNIILLETLYCCIKHVNLFCLHASYWRNLIIVFYILNCVAIALFIFYLNTVIFYVCQSRLKPMAANSKWTQNNGGRSNNMQIWLLCIVTSFVIFGGSRQAHGKSYEASDGSGGGGQCDLARSFCTDTGIDECHQVYLYLPYPLWWKHANLGKSGMQEAPFVGLLNEATNFYARKGIVKDMK